MSAFIEVFLTIGLIIMMTFVSIGLVSLIIGRKDVDYIKEDEGRDE